MWFLQEYFYFLWELCSFSLYRLGSQHCSIFQQRVNIVNLSRFAFLLVTSVFSKYMTDVISSITVTSLSSGSRISGCNKTPFLLSVSLFSYQLYALTVDFISSYLHTLLDLSPLASHCFRLSTIRCFSLPSFFRLSLSLSLAFSLPRRFSHVRSSSHSHSSFSLSAWPPSSVSYLSKLIACCMILAITHVGEIDRIEK